MNYETVLNPFRKNRLNEAIAGALDAAVTANQSMLIDIVIHLKPSIPSGIPLDTPMRLQPDFQPLDEEMIGKVTRRLKRRLNVLFFGNSYVRYRKSIEFAAWHHSCPHNHLHIIAELPKRWVDDRFATSKRSFLAMKNCVSAFCEENPFCQPLTHIDYIQNLEAAVNYNHRSKAIGRYVV
jgi:hypothetical protein